MARQDDPEVVKREYATETRLLTRASVYADATGPDANDLLLEVIARRRPATVLEVGCGPGTLAERLHDQHGITVRAIDISPRMVDLARRRGVDAQLGDMQHLPFPDESFDCAIAAWVLYHVPDLDRGLREIHRVLRPAGELVAATNSNRHLAELWELLGQEGYELSFNAENAREILQRHFSGVDQNNIEGKVTFSDREMARRYVAASIRGSHLADQVPELTTPLMATRRNCILVASKSDQQQSVGIRR